MSTQVDTGATVNGSLKDASLDRLVCLQRHWMWADEAMARFDRELADGWDYDDDAMSDRPFGAYYHWCALLCAFGEAALDHGLLSPLELEPIRQDLEATLPGLRASRQLLVVIPARHESQHRRNIPLLCTRFANGSTARMRMTHKNGLKLSHSFRGSRQRASGAALGSQETLALSSQAHIERISPADRKTAMGVAANQAAIAQALVSHVI